MRKLLLSSVKLAVKNERTAIINVLRHLRDFEYCHLELGYSRAESYARIASMRLIKEVPIVEKQIEKGEMQLTQTVDLFTAIKKSERESGVKLSEEQKVGLVEKLVNCSNRETERILSEELTVELKTSASETKNLKLDEKSYHELANLAKQLGVDNLADVVKLLVKEKRDELKSQKVTVKSIEPKEQSRYVPVQLKRTLLKKANYQCEFVALNGRRCSERIGLQVDHHYVPFCQGGRTILANLKILCHGHNLSHAVTTLGSNRMQKYLKS